MSAKLICEFINLDSEELHRFNTGRLYMMFYITFALTLDDTMRKVGKSMRVTSDNATIFDVMNTTSFAICFVRSRHLALTLAGHFLPNFSFLRPEDDGLEIKLVHFQFISFALASTACDTVSNY